MNERRSFNVGYLFLQELCTQLRIDKICRTIKERHKYKYNLQAILTDLVYARILSPSSKLASYDYCQTLLEPPKYSLQDVYRSLSVIAEESDFIQSELYKILISFIQEIIVSSITIAQTTISKLKRKAILSVMVKVRKTVRIQL